MRNSSKKLAKLLTSDLVCQTMVMADSFALAWLSLQLPEKHRRSQVLSMSIIKSKQRRRLCPCCSEPTHDVYS
ncbi:unnamed protein product [Brassica oleracea var. botrytis]